MHMTCLLPAARPACVSPLAHGTWLGRLRQCDAGVTLVEFALILPILIFVLLMGTELAYYAAVRMQVNQIAISIADNASRIGQTDNSSVAPTVTEQNIDSVMFGAMKQGASISLKTRGRVILSSLERDATTSKQYFHWQRCQGTLTNKSAYGPQNFGLTSGTSLTGVGKNGNKLQASATSSVMVVEVYYQYTPLFNVAFINAPAFREEAIFQIRDDRNLTAGISPGTSASAC
jgi:Flp pilus assembly protein TadG